MNRGKILVVLQRVLVIGLVVMLSWSLAPVQPAHAADFNATTVSELIEAIEKANDEVANPGPDIIYLLPGHTYTLESFNNTSHGLNGLPLITSHITIKSSGDSATIERFIDAQDEFRLFFVAGGGRLYLEKIILNNGLLASGPASEGGAIYNEDLVVLHDVTIQNNVADRGGAIYNKGTGTGWLLRDVTIQGNVAEWGGGIYNEYGPDVSNIEDSVISNNTALTEGGGIYSMSGLDIEDTRISDNTAPRCGGVEATAGGTLLGVSIVNNTAEETGGGLCSMPIPVPDEYYDELLRIRASEIVLNEAGFRGGGIYNSGEIDARENSNISYNFVKHSMSASSVGAYGGGIYNDGELTIRSSRVIANSAYGGRGHIGHMDGYDAYGGGISNNGALTVSHSQVSSNLATGGKGLTMMIGASGNGGTAWGGGIHNTGAIRFLNSLLEGNIAKMSQGGGGLIPGDPGIGRGGGIYNANSAYFVKTLFKTNVAHYGAGAFNDTDAELNITSSTLSHNAAFGPFALGGAIYNSYPAGQANLVYVTITDNYSDDQIGGVWSGGTVLIEGSIVAGNDDPSPFNIADCNWVPSVTNMTSLGHNVFGSKRCPVNESLGDFDLAELGLTIDDVLEAWMTVYPEGPFDDTKSTMLYRLKPGSLAIDQGHSASCPTTDQRGGSRPVDGDGDGSSLCDIGSYEYDPSNP